MLNRTHRLGSIAVAIFIVFLMAGSFLVLVPIQLVVRPVAAVSPGPSISSVWGTGAGRNWSPFVGGALEIPTSSYPKVILSGVTTYPLAVDGMGNLYFVDGSSPNYQADLYVLLTGSTTPSKVFTFNAPATTYASVYGMHFDGRGDVYLVAYCQDASLTFEVSYLYMLDASKDYLSSVLVSDNSTWGGMNPQGLGLSSGAVITDLTATSLGGIYFMQATYNSTSGSTDTQVLYIPPGGKTASVIATIPNAIGGSLPGDNLNIKNGYLFITVGGSVYEVTSSKKVITLFMPPSISGTYSNSVWFTSMDSAGNLYFWWRIVYGTSTSMATSTLIVIGKILWQDLQLGTPVYQNVSRASYSGYQGMGYGDSSFKVNSEGDAFFETRAGLSYSANWSLYEVLASSTEQVPIARDNGGFGMTTFGDDLYLSSWSNATISEVTAYATSPLAVKCGPSLVVVGSTTTCKATVQGSGSAPAGLVTWSNSSSGKFSHTSCKLSKGVCSVKFTPTAAVSPVVLKASYGGNSKNSPSAGAFNLIVTMKATKTTFSCKPSSAVAGSSTSITCTAKVTGYSPSGTITWSWSGTGAISLVSGGSCGSGGGPTPHSSISCSVSFTAVSAGSVTIQAAYSGDSNNKGSSKTTTLAIR